MQLREGEMQLRNMLLQLREMQLREMQPSKMQLQPYGASRAKTIQSSEGSIFRKLQELKPFKAPRVRTSSNLAKLQGLKPYKVPRASTLRIMGARLYGPTFGTKSHLNPQPSV